MGRRVVNAFIKLDCSGKEAQWGSRVPSGALGDLLHASVPHQSTNCPSQPSVMCLRKECQTIPPSSGSTAGPEVPAGPLQAWIRSRPGGVPLDSKGPFVLPRQGRPDGSHHLSGCEPQFSSRAGSHWHEAWEVNSPFPSLR